MLAEYIIYNYVNSIMKYHFLYNNIFQLEIKEVKQFSTTQNKIRTSIGDVHYA